MLIGLGQYHKGFLKTFLFEKNDVPALLLPSLKETLQREEDL